MNNVIMRNGQRGMTYLGMLILMIIIAFCAIVVIKVMPVYLEHFKVESSLKSLAQDSKANMAQLPPAEIRKLLMRRLEVNDVSYVKKENIAISREGNKTMVDVSYEARVTLFFNLDLVARFPDNHIELGGP